ncbi:unnamed protein product [Caenorhabditis angaria]|uniref:Uncharacterized protein n=1 Tax=Caenorhabditis angaria TaxID=860376 RepID=A0A9P1IRR6_9PELO|nr:unnamed protein product [Caenorhabditis angaria]
MEEELQQLRTNASSDLMSDEDFISQIESMSVEAQEREINDLLKAMHENRIVSWDEAERILQETDRTPIKCSLPEQTRPTEPDNEVDVDSCIRKLLDNDPSLKEVNLNNMKRTPVPAIKRLLEALAYNEHCERISLANMGLYDHDIMVLVTVIEMNQAIKKVNLETNYLSGEFFSKLFKAALTNETVEEIKAVNQGVSFSTQSEKEIIDSIVKNKGLTKISINFRLPEGRHKVENATLRNGEYKRVKRREAALKAKQEQEELAKNPVPKLAPEKPPAPAPAPIPPKVQIPAKIPYSLVTPEPPPSSSSSQNVVQTAPPKPAILAKQLSFQRASREDEEETELVAIPEPKKVQIPKMFQKSENENGEIIVKKTGKVWKPKLKVEEKPESWKKKVDLELPERSVRDRKSPARHLKSPEVHENGRRSPNRSLKSPEVPNSGRRSPGFSRRNNLKSPEVAENGRKSPEPPRRNLKSPVPPQNHRKSPEPPRRNLKSPAPLNNHRMSPEPPRRNLKSPQNFRKSPEPTRNELKSPDQQPPGRNLKSPIPSRNQSQRLSPEPPRNTLKSSEPKESENPSQAKSAKNMWEHRMAKLEKKEQKSKKPLLSIQQIREMERNGNVFEQKIKAKKPKIMENAATETTVIRRTVMRQRKDEQPNA